MVIYFVCKTISDIFDAYKNNNIDNIYKEAKKKKKRTKIFLKNLTKRLNFFAGAKFRWSHFVERISFSYISHVTIESVITARIFDTATPRPRADYSCKWDCSASQQFTTERASNRRFLPVPSDILARVHPFPGLY